MKFSSTLLSSSMLLPSLSMAYTNCTGLGLIVASQLSNFPPAQTFCSSNFPIPTLTKTYTAPVSTITTTYSTTTSPTTVTTVTITNTAPAVTANTTVATNTVITTASTETDTVTLTETDPGTVTNTVNSYINVKRDVNADNVKPTSKPCTTSSSAAKPASTTSIISSSSVKSSSAAASSTKASSSAVVTSSTKASLSTPAITSIPGFPTNLPIGPIQSSIFSSILSKESSIIGSICSCIESQVTTTASVYPSTTTSVVATATTSVTATATATVTPTVVASFTATAYSSVTSTTVTTTVTTTTTYTTVTATNVVDEGRYPCNPANSETNTGGQGGCSSGCYCDTRGGDTSHAVCDSEGSCGTGPCNSDADCGPGTACIIIAGNVCGGPVCGTTAGCSSSYTPPSKAKRAFARDFMSLVGRARSGQTMPNGAVLDRRATPPHVNSRVKVTPPSSS